MPYYREELKWSDGSVECDLPMERLAELFNVNHFIVSQVNLHYDAFAEYSEMGSTSVAPLLGYLKKQIKCHFRNAAEFGLNTSVLKFSGVGLVPFFTQKYEGDITICPCNEVSIVRRMDQVLRNLEKNEFSQVVRISERSCWPYIAQIRTMCRIEFALEKAVRYLRCEQAVGDEKKGHKHSVGRVPSFYTSYSSVKLNGLESASSEDFNHLPRSNLKNKRNRSLIIGGAVMTL